MKKKKKIGVPVRTLIALLAVALLIGGAIGGTMAWLTADSETVTNTFTESDINIALTETTKDFKMVPGCTIEKDPTITVEADSVDCWVFVEVIESENLKNYISYDIDPNNWTELDGVDNVYCTIVPVTDVTKARRIKVLGYTDENNEFHPNEVLVKTSVTKEDMDALENEGATQPTLTFKAYASQLMKNNTEQFTAKEAWDNIKPADSGNEGGGSTTPTP